MRTAGMGRMRAFWDAASDEALSSEHPRGVHRWTSANRDIDKGRPATSGAGGAEEVKWPCAKLATSPWSLG